MNEDLLLFINKRKTTQLLGARISIQMSAPRPEFVIRCRLSASEGSLTLRRFQRTCSCFEGQSKLDARLWVFSPIERVRPVGSSCCGGMRNTGVRCRRLGIASPVYRSGREPAMRMSTSLLALCSQSAPEPTCEAPIRARSRSDASRSFRRSPLLLARFTSPSIAP